MHIIIKRLSAICFSYRERFSPLALCCFGAVHNYHTSVYIVGLPSIRIPTDSIDTNHKSDLGIQFKLWSLFAHNGQSKFILRHSKWSVFRSKFALPDSSLVRMTVMRDWLILWLVLLIGTGRSITADCSECLKYARPKCAKKIS